MKLNSLRKKQILCVAAGVALCLTSWLLEGASSDLSEGHYLRRNSYGHGQVGYHVLVGGLTEEEIPVELELRERTYREEEISKAFDEAYEELCCEMLGDNPSLGQVRTPLNLVSRLENYGFRVRWETENPDVVSSFGDVDTSFCDPDGQEIALTATLSTKEFKRSYVILITVYPPMLSQEESMLQAYETYVDRLDQQQNNNPRLELPDEYEGRKLTYRLEDQPDRWILLFLGVVMAGMLAFKERSDEKKKKREREVQMLLDYSDILSKLMVFLGAGITMKKAWERVVADYEASVKGQRKRSRFAYEEMCKTYYQMASGVSEAMAYLEFGGRCQLLPYRKLASLLEQNLKTGTKNLRNLLELEMTSAFEERKALARRLGEEAGTKLLFPLFLMLVVVMVIIVMPAMMSFQF